MRWLDNLSLGALGLLMAAFAFVGGFLVAVIVLT
jgi:hypothetical protein